jgi:two-component system response regulator AtoC
LVARAIQELSARHRGPFVKVNCAALPQDLLESELLYPALQGKLMHVLQDGQFSRVGGRSTLQVDARVLAATNQDLEAAVAAGQFREDLFCRLNVIQVRLRPLRERVEEIPLLAEYFMRRHSTLFGRDSVPLAAETMQRLVRHRFPGNVRELENVIKRMIVLSDPDLQKGALSATTSGRAPYKIPGPARPAAMCPEAIARQAVQMAERDAILQALGQTRWKEAELDAGQHPTRL